MVSLLGGGVPGGAFGASRPVLPLSARSQSGDRDPASLLATVRPDYRSYIETIRPLEERRPSLPGERPIYMALVRPGGDDPRRRDNAPYAGPGVRNDIVYRDVSLDLRRSAAWTLLLLDHEYFHARHLAGATSLPLPGDVPAAQARHYFEAAAWGFNVSEARMGRYNGLREDEFREALDRYGEHYRALRDLTRDDDPLAWQKLTDLLREPADLVMVMMAGSPPSEARGHRSDRDRSPATP